jgi:site-specific DNA recombinase
MRSLGYVRVSLEKQADNGVSLDAQTAKIRAMAQIQGAELTEIIVDGGESAKSLDRPGMGRLMKSVRDRQVDSIIVAKLDRLTRSVKDLADLLELFSRKNVSLVSVAESLDTRTAAGRLVINMLISVAQWEREQLGERTRDALRFKKQRGERVGNIPYGYRLGNDGTHIEANPSEQKIITRVKSLRNKGQSLRSIASALNKHALKTRSGSPWHHVYVGSLLRRA